MIVCVCNRYSDRDVIHAARDGAACAEDAYCRLGRGPNCGMCLELAESLIDGVRMSIASPLKAAE